MTRCPRVLNNTACPRIIRITQSTRFKARRNHPLITEQKERNRVLGRYRIIVEHTLAQINQFQILAQMYRHPRMAHGDVVRVVAGLVNRRIRECPQSMALNWVWRY